MRGNYTKQMFDLSGGVAIVTGGLGMLGGEYAKTLSAAGAKVAVFDIVKKKNPLISKLALVYHLDITDRKAVETAVKDIVNKLGTPTILVNNAGLSSIPNALASENGPFENYPETSWDGVIDSHLKGMFIASQIFIKYIKKTKKKGSIINVSSTYGIVSPDQSIYEFRRKNGEEYYKPVGYTVAKAGVLGFTRWLAEYCGPSIRVNTLVPGGVALPIDNPDFRKEYCKRTILGRMANPNEYNAAVLFLASKASSYMTGSMLIVDGGWTAR